MCLSLLWNPNKSIDEALHNESSRRSFLALLLTSLFGLGAINIFNVISTYQNASHNLLWSGRQLLFINLYLLLGIVLINLVWAFLINIVMKTLAGKSSYYAGFTSNVYAFMQAKFGLLLGSLIVLLAFFFDDKLMLTGLASLILIKALTVVALLVVLIYCLLSCSTFLKSLRDLYHTNMMTVLAGVLVLLNGILIIAALAKIVLLK